MSTLPGDAPQPFGRAVLPLLGLALAMAIGFTIMTSFSTVQEAAKAELGLSDQVMSLIQGVSAAIPLVLFSIPIGIAALRFAARTRYPTATALLVALPVLLVLEAGQVLVFSRTTDATALLAAITGALAGVMVARVARSETAAPLRSGTTG